MVYNKIIALVGLLATSGEYGIQKPLDLSKMDVDQLAQELVRVSNGSLDIAELAANSIKEVVRIQMPSVSENQLGVIYEVSYDLINVHAGEWLDKSIALWKKYYTAEEMREILVFYSTKVGQKILQTLPQVVGEGHEIGLAIGGKVDSVLAQKVNERLKVEGLKPIFPEQLVN